MAPCSLHVPVTSGKMAVQTLVHLSAPCVNLPELSQLLAGPDPSSASDAESAHVCFSCCGGWTARW